MILPQKYYEDELRTGTSMVPRVLFGRKVFIDRPKIWKQTIYGTKRHKNRRKRKPVKYYRVRLFHSLKHGEVISNPNGFIMAASTWDEIVKRIKEES